MTSTFAITPGTDWTLTVYVDPYAALADAYRAHRGEQLAGVNSNSVGVTLSGTADTAAELALAVYEAVEALTTVCGDSPEPVALELVAGTESVEVPIYSGNVRTEAAMSALLTEVLA